MTAQNSTVDMDLRVSGVVYGPDVKAGAKVKWFPPIPGAEDLPDLGESVAWLSPSNEVFGTVTSRGTETHVNLYPYAEVTVDRNVPRG